MEMNEPSSERCVLGVDLGGTKILSAVVTESGQVISRGKKKTKPDRSTEEILDRIVRSCEKALEAAEMTIDQIEAIGVGSPGPLDPDRGVVIETPNVNLANASITEYISNKLGKPAFLDNDVNVGTLGEFVYGAGKGKKDVIGIFMGTGIGGGVIVDGNLVHGYSKNAGELGHMKIVAYGEKCGCGQKGCLEAYASKTAMIKTFQKAVKKGEETILTKLVGDKWNKLTSKVFYQAFEEKDKLVIKTVEKAADYTGIAVGSLLNIFSPEVVIIGGGLIEALGERVLETIRKSAEENSFPICFKGVEIVPAALGDDSGILGAAALAWRRLDEPSA